MHTTILPMRKSVVWIVFFDNDKLVFAKINEAGHFNILIRKIGVDK